MTEQTKNNGTIAKSAASVGIAVMCSRVLGLVREQVFAGMFGAGFIYDAFVVAFRIPNLLRDLFAEGALSAAFVTVFSAYDRQRTQEETWQLAANVLNCILIFLCLITLLMIFFAEEIVTLLAPDFSLINGKTELTVKLTRIMLPFLVFISLSAVVMGILNTKGRFFIPALASSFFNLGSLIGGTSLAFILPRYGQPAIVGMAIGTLVGGLLQLGMQIPTLYKTGFRYAPVMKFTDPGLKRILTLMIPATIGLSATQINLFINTNFAASCAEGSVSWLYYAFRLVQLPIGVFGVALSIAMLPVLAKQAADKNIGAMKDTMVSSLTMVFALTVPATVGLIILSQPIIRLIYQHGAFTAADTLATADTLCLYSIGLFAYSANKVLVPAFYALDKTKYPVIASFLAIIINIVIILLTIDTYQHRAIALSTSCTMLINFLFLMAVLYKSLHGYSLTYLGKGCLKIGIATLALSALLFLCRSLLAGWFMGTVVQQAAALILVIFSSAALYAVILDKLKLAELTILTEKVRSRFKKK
ncbi:MAG: murein biosynthesis integral membrane protein MurJ [Desulfobulbaceae bacterium]|nr:murein biosynthesis integral membrane protein MurJ [Desulfobulbaceae bacterium]